MSKTPAWSYTALNAFETCPKRYYLTRVSKEVVEPQTEVLRYGNEVHKAFELRATQGTPLPESLAQYESVVQTILSKDGEPIVEKQMAIDSNFTPVGWFDKATWCRGIVDIGIIGKKSAVLLDWKTGKRKPESEQLHLFAGLAFAHYPHIETVTTGFVWLKDDKIDKHMLTREQTGEIWNIFLPRVSRLTMAYAKSKWEPKPSGLCSKWCPVPKSKCEFSGCKG